MQQICREMLKIYEIPYTCESFPPQKFPHPLSERAFKFQFYLTLSPLSFENEYKTITELKKYKAYTIPVKAWHRPFNPGKDVAEIIEIWEGNSNENDIERSQNPVSILHGV